MVVLETHRAAVGVLQIGPRLRCVRQDQVGQFCMVLVVQAPQAGNVMVGQLHVGRLAKAGDRPQRGVGQRGRHQPCPADVGRGVKAQVLPDPPARPPRSIQAAAEAVAERGVGQRVGRLALDRRGKAGGGIQGDGPVEGEVSPTPQRHLFREEDERGRLACACAGLDGEMAAAAERLQRGGLFVGRGKGHGTDLSGSSKPTPQTHGRREGPHPGQVPESKGANVSARVLRTRRPVRPMR